MRPDRPPDIVVAELAGRQHGVVSRSQLTAAGLSRDAIAHRVATGRLHPVHRGVYLVGHEAAPPLAPETAALLAVGRGAVLSHDTAAAIWRMRAPADSPIHVTVPHRGRRQRPGLVVHVSRNREPADNRRRDGLPLTAPARTLLDLAAALDERDLRWALNEALVLRLVRPAEITGLLGRATGHRGAGRLRRALDAATRSGPSPTRSEAERKLLDLVARARLPAPRTNVRLHGHLVDAHWPTSGLVVEVDGFAFHRTRRAFDRDHRRDAQLTAAGQRVLRLTWEDLARAPEATAATLAAALARA